MKADRRPQWALLRYHRDFRPLWAGQAASALGDIPAYEAVLGLVPDFTGSGPAVGLWTYPARRAAGRPQTGPCGDEGEVRSPWTLHTVHACRTGW